MVWNKYRKIFSFIQTDIFHNTHKKKAKVSGIIRKMDLQKDGKKNNLKNIKFPMNINNHKNLNC